MTASSSSTEDQNDLNQEFNFLGQTLAKIEVYTRNDTIQEIGEPRQLHARQYTTIS
jgi:hypothetical protein